MKKYHINHWYIKSIQLFMLVFGALFLSHTVHAKQLLYFYLNNEVITVDYQGDKFNPTSIVFDAKCDPRWCEFDERSQDLLVEFGYALARGQIYVLDVDDIVDDCTQFEPCEIPFREELKENIGTTSKKNKPNDSFAKGIKSDVQQAIINAGVEGLIDYLTSLEESSVPKINVVFNKNNMKPYHVCRVVKGGCSPEERVTVVNNSNGSTSFGISNFNLYEAYDRELQSTIQNWLFNIASASQCIVTYTGPVGEQTAQWTCFIRR